METTISGRRLAAMAGRLRRTRRRLRRSSLLAPLLYIVAGVAAGAALLGVDVMVGEAPIPAWLQVGAPLARSSLVGLMSSFLFVVSVVFWVRIWAVQMSAQPVLSRVLIPFLTDRVQRHSMGFIIGAMAYIMTVMRAVPQEDAGLEVVPHIAVSTAYVLALAVAVIIVFAIDNAARWGQPGQLIRRISDRTLKTIRTMHPPIGGSVDAGEAATDLRSTAGRPTSVVTASDSGWVRSIDEDLLLDAVPARTTIELQVRLGSFAFEGSPLLNIWTDRPEEIALGSLREAISIGPDPSFDDDVVYSISELVDIAQRSMTTTTSDVTTAREAVLYVGVVLRELLLRDLPDVDRVDDADRRLLRTQDPTFEDYLDAAFGRLRPIAGESPAISDAILMTIGMVSEQLDGHGLAERQTLLQEHARLVVEEAEEHATGSQRPVRAEEQARAHGVSPHRSDAAEHHPA